MSVTTFDDPVQERERQRKEGEARAILHDLDKLGTYDEAKKSRWIWELLQNAKDVATDNGVEIIVKLSKDRLIFRHNGLPFKTTHLLAILYKTSTKSLGGEDGTTGKYGTGFVTTHILNKQLVIAGVHSNASGEREFSLKMDRSISASLRENEMLNEMQNKLNDAFIEIEQINKSLANEKVSTWRFR